MRVKAFSLIELIVVILLIGIMYFLVMSAYTNKKSHEEKLTLKDMPNYIKKNFSKQNATFFLYGQECDKSLLFLKNKTFQTTPDFSLSADSSLLTCKPNSEFEEFVPYSKKIDKKEEHICLEIDFKDGDFYDKLIVNSPNKAYVFLPLFQEVKVFDSLEDAKELCQNNSYPKSIDEYYRE
ncbi:type II secretion system protein [Sulfurospirillum arcachonense]|uniref:type II secretion system protein n=1 Tax=Sulfurospirillum arcachonense TaxID=57666 RepID=UPI00046A9C1E|nr:prepilin-type N-terminal cleavage/methylation domain-containing protein [Sulfurospirillum arcachonense]